jgi:hypothetical protein
MNKIINSEYYPTWNDPQGVIELEKQLIAGHGKIYFKSNKER